MDDGGEHDVMCVRSSGVRYIERWMRVEMVSRRWSREGDGDVLKKRARARRLGVSASSLGLADVIDEIAIARGVAL